MNDAKTPGTPQTPAGGESPKDRHALEGEPGIPSVGQRPKISVSYKGVLSVVAVIVTLTVVSAISIERTFFAAKPQEAQRLGDRPAAAAAEVRRLDMALALAASTPASASSASARMIPAIAPLPEDARPARVAPEDAPVVLLASRPGTAGQATPRPEGHAAGSAVRGWAGHHHQP